MPRLLLSLLLVSLLLLAGCAARPDVTLFCEHDEAETSGPRSTRTSTNKVGASATFHLR